MTAEAQGPDRGSAECAALGDDLVWAIRIISMALRRGASEALGALPGGSRAYLVLMALAAADDRAPTQLELAGRVGLDRTVITYLLDDLERLGLLSRQPHPQDRRARLVVLTQEGRSRLQQVRTDVAATQARLLAQLSEEEQVAFRELLSRVALTAQRSAVT